MGEKEKGNKIEEAKKTLDYKKIDTVTKFGVEDQNKMGDFSQQVLSYVQKQSVGDVGNAIKDLVGKIEESNPTELGNKKRGFFNRLIKREEYSIYERTDKYQKIGSEVDRTALVLGMHKNKLEEDNKILEDLYKQNIRNYESLGVYIEAGEIKLKELEEVLNNKEEVKEKSFFEEDDIGIYRRRLEKRIHDLKITRHIILQQAPQIRLIQNTNHSLVERIGSTVNIAIPLWRNQVTIALTMLSKEEIVSTQRKVTGLAKIMLERNTEEIEGNTKRLAEEVNKKETEVGALEEVQEELLETLQDALSIQVQGALKLKEARENLGKIEGNLKNQIVKVVD